MPLAIEVINNNFSVWPFAKQAQTALLATTTDLANAMQASCRSNISGAGKFSGQWVDGLTASIAKGASESYEIRVEHLLGAMVRPHVYGATIVGKPMLWIPLEFAPEAKNIRAREYPARLFRVDRKKGPPPLLFSVQDRQPKYFGREQVTVPARWNIAGTCRAIVDKAQDIFNAHMAKGAT